MENQNSKEYIYQRIAENIEHKIYNNVLKLGDKLPSIREICRENGVSMSSAIKAYSVLEGKSLIASQPQSGYYVCYVNAQRLSAPETTKPQLLYDCEDNQEVISRVYAKLDHESTVVFSLGVPEQSLLPVAKLNKALSTAINGMAGSGTTYDLVQGNQKLRRQIARGSFTWNGKLEEEDIVTTSGCINAISLCLMSLVKSGDVIAVESPVYFGILQLAQSLGLKVAELPTNPITGIEIDALENALKNQNVKVCLLISNFNNPLGSCMPIENKKAVVSLIQKYNVPLIEDDLYADVYFGDHRPTSCKTYDESGLVLWCGSISKTLAPGYRVGWVAPGMFKEKILRTKMYHALSTPSITQQAVANFLENGRYESHLRKLRKTLSSNSQQYQRAIAEYFPHDTKMSRPQGGFIQWVELNNQIDSLKLYELAIKKNISIAPGSMFSLQKQYNNCIRLSYGLEWNTKVDEALKTVGNLAKALL